MRTRVFLLICISSAVGFAQQEDILELSRLVNRARERSPEILAAARQMDAMGARVSQMGVVDDPEFRYMREEMPSPGSETEAMHRFELMQMVRFPSKLGTERSIARIEAEHAHHEHTEKSNEIVARVKVAYAELWYAQQALVVNHENRRLLQQFTTIAQTRYGVGVGNQQDVLKAMVELEKLENERIRMEQEERTSVAMLAAILNEPVSTLSGVAWLPGDVSFSPGLDTLERLSLRSRPMIIHDSVTIDQNSAMVSLSKQEFLPDFRFGVGYMTNPMADFRGWSVSAGVTLPFAPWTLGKASGRVEESEAGVLRARASYDATRNMVIARVRDLYARAQSTRAQLERYTVSILPRAEQSLQSSLSAYQTGQTDFLMLIDAYRTLVELSMESIMIRMQFEHAVAALEREVGLEGIAEIKG